MTLPPPEHGELEAWRSLVAGGGHVQELGGAVCTALEQASRSAMFNRVLGLGLREPATEAGLAAIDGFFAEVGVAYGIALAPQAEPPELPRWLEARGFHRGYAWTKFRRGVEPPPAKETGLRIEAVGPERADAFADVFMLAYGAADVLRPLLERLPSTAGWQCFLAYADGAPAATAALFVAGDVGWLGVAGTLPEFRRRGAQGALLRTRIAAASACGCSSVVTETGAPVAGKPGNSYRNIVRAGFEPVYVRENYLSTPDADTSGTSA